MSRKTQQDDKPLYWCGRTYKDYLKFPDAVQDDAGYQLDRVQRGLDPLNFKPVPLVGSGTYEIRVNEDGNTYRRVLCRKV